MARILLSALSARRGGGLTYLRRIISAFPRNGCHRLSILSATPIDGIPPHPAVDWVRAPAWTSRPIPRFLFGALYFRFVWQRRRDFDLIYFAGGSFDLKLPPDTKRAVAFRNMLPFDPDSARRYPLGWMRFRHWLLKYVQAHAFRSADLVIFISNYAREVIDSLLKRRGAAVTIPHGVVETSMTLDPTLAARLPARFVLYLSILDVYKAQVELVEAWALLRQRRLTQERLVLAGPANQKYLEDVQAAITRNDLRDEVILLGEVRHDQVFDLARRAEVNAFMSACENCPNLMLELMRVGRPMLISDRQPMPELGGSDLDYVDPYDPVAIASALAVLLDDHTHRQRVASAASTRSLLFDWQEAGQRTWNAIIAVAEDRPVS